MERDLYDSEIEWYLTRASAALGVSSAHGAWIARVERGSASVLTAAPEYTDEQLQAAKRDRRARSLWARLPGDVRAVLRAWYGGAAPCDPPGANPLREPPEVRRALDRWAGVAWLLASDARSGLLRASRKGSGAEVRVWVTTAEKAVQGAHRAVQAVRQGEAERWVTSSAL